MSSTYRNLKLIGLLLFSFLIKGNCVFGQIDKSVDVLTLDEYDVEGNWVLVEYLDNIISNKTISEYRMIRPSWFAIVLNITNDTMIYHGSIVNRNNKLEISNNKDSLTTFNNFGSWKLSYNTIKNQLDISGLDSPNNTYHYRRLTKDEQIILTVDSSALYPIRQGINDLFKQTIFFGRYLDLSTNDTILFHKNGTISGSKKYTKYQIDDYFGTSHPFQNQDVIRLTKHNKSKDWLNWKFEDNQVTCTSFTERKNDHHYFLSDKFFTFKRLAEPTSVLKDSMTNYDYWASQDVASATLYVFYPEGDINNRNLGAFILDKKGMLNPYVLDTFTTTLDNETFQLLYNAISQEDKGFETRYFCFEPHHGIILKNTKGGIVGHITFCLECNTYGFSSHKIEHLSEKLFRTIVTNAGVPETPQEIANWYKRLNNTTDE